MTEEQIALAKRAVACRAWRWMRGMSNDRGQTIDCVDLIAGKAYCGEWDADITALPDLTDPATLGCLLALVREAMNDPNTCVCWSFSDDLWMCEAKHEYEGKTYLGLFAQASTYAGSLVLALEAAQCGR